MHACMHAKPYKDAEILRSDIPDLDIMKVRAVKYLSKLLRGICCKS